MRYLSSISLALIVLMALACTATPAEPTPATPAPAAPAPTSSGAFSCMELADKLATAQTETAARVLTSSWNESGCAQKAAGVTKVPTARPTAIPATSTFMDREFGKNPAPPKPTMTQRERMQLVESLFAKTPVPTDTPVPPTDCVRVETTDARLEKYPMNLVVPPPRLPKAVAFELENQEHLQHSNINWSDNRDVRQGQKHPQIWF